MGWFRKKAASSDDSEFNDDYYDQPAEQQTDTAAYLPTTNNKDTVGCGTRFRQESNPCQSWFPHRDPVNQKLHDIPETFAPQTRISKLWKVLLLCFTLGSMVYGLVVHPTTYFYFAYMTNWVYLIILLYAMIQVINVFMGLPEYTNFRVKLTWALLIIAAHMSAVVTVLFWALIFEPGDTVTYLHIAGHGATMILVLVDGMIIGRIPVRVMHWMGLALPAEFLYVLWSLIHGLLEIGNPNLNDEKGPDEDNDDLIYEVLDWRNDWDSTLIYVVICLFAVGPIVFLLMWGFSIKRRYVDERPKVDDVVEGSIFNTNDWE